MNKTLNILMFFLLIIFFLSTYKFYSSTKNIEVKNFNRTNIDQIISDKVSNLPILNDDTNNVIEFNSGYNEIDENKQRKFWNLFKK